MLFHGRITYVKMSFMIVFYFNKNIVFTLGQFFFAFMCNFSRQSLYQDWLISFFNMVFTTYALALYSLFEQDLQSRDWEKLLPETFLYFFGQRNLGFNAFNFLGWIISAVLESGFIFLFVRLLDKHSNTFSGFRESHYELVSMVIYIVIILHIQIKLFLHTSHLLCVILAGYFVTSLGFFLMYLFAFDRLMAFSYFRTLRIIWLNKNFYLVVFFLLTSLFLMNFTKQQIRWV